MVKKKDAVDLSGLYVLQVCRADKSLGFAA
jgi:hypothetical protein